MRFENYLNDNLKDDFSDVLNDSSSYMCDVTLKDTTAFKNNYVNYQKRIQNENSTFNSLVSDINAARLRKLAEEKRKEEEKLAKEKYEKDHAEELHVEKIIKENKKKQRLSKTIRFMISIALIAAFVFYIYYAFNNYAFVEHFGITGFIWILIGAGITLLALTIFTIKFNLSYSRAYAPDYKNETKIYGRKKANFFATLSLIMIGVIAFAFVMTKLGSDNLPYTIFDEKTNSLLSSSNKSDYDANEKIIMELYDSYIAFSNDEKNKLKEKNNFESYISGYNSYKVELVKDNLNSLTTENANELLIKAIEGYDSLIYAQRDMITNDMKSKYDFYLQPYNQVIYINDVYDNITNKYDLKDDVVNKYNSLSNDVKEFVYNKNLMDDFDLIYVALENVYFTLLEDDTYSVSAKQTFSAESLVIPKYYNNKVVSTVNNFNNCISLTELVVPSTVTKITGGALKGCSGLTKLELPFIGTSLANTELKTFDTSTAYNMTFGSIFGGETYDGATSVLQEYHSYDYGQTRFLYIPSGLTEVKITGSTLIPYGAFMNCNMIKELYISKDIKTFGSKSFQGTSLTNVYYEGTIEDWNSISIGSNNTAINTATVYYFTENGNDESRTGNWWFYDDKIIKVLVID